MKMRILACFTHDIRHEIMFNFFQLCVVGCASLVKDHIILNRHKVGQKAPLLNELMEESILLPGSSSYLTASTILKSTTATSDTVLPWIKCPYDLKYLD